MSVPHDDTIKSKVQNLLATGLSIREAAAQTAVPVGTARRWSAQATKTIRSATAPARNLLAGKLADDGELARLRRENGLLKQLVASLLAENA